MKKVHYLAAAAATCIILGVISVFLFSGIGFSLASVMDPVFYSELMDSHLMTVVLSFIALGIALGSIFSGIGR